MKEINRKKLIYSILKEIEKGNEPKREDYGLEFEQWGELAELIRDCGFVRNLGVMYANDVVYIVSFSSAKITIQGLDYLEENSVFARTYKGLKEVRDWLK
ncbi:YjcQ family protein [Bacillus sp. CHD6a]|uniref:YjcQ family protein n=1 Tax=Bacillus sp. CHD6a TaxID=1643452 RepID=UPI0006CDE590|nr:YjcQ family protein [Bacillus sp. CHD6a]KPB06318.1 hypothetical protein AAV98_00485 [Bacillus sp. CHD6a]